MKEEEAKKKKKIGKEKTKTKIDKNTIKTMVGIHNAAETGAIKLF